MDIITAIDTIAYYESIAPDPEDIVPIGIDSATGDPIVGFGDNDMPLRRCKCGMTVEVPAPCGHTDCMIVEHDEPQEMLLSGQLIDR